MNQKIKKRIYKDKQYTLNYDDISNIYYVEFKNGQNILCKVGVRIDI